MGDEATFHEYVGNPDDLRAEELRERAWAILEPRLLRAQEAAAAGAGGHLPVLMAADTHASAWTGEPR